MISVYPVSYTHLDVYKRQAQGLVAELLGAYNDIGLGQVLGHGEAHAGQSQSVEAVVIGGGAQGGLHIAGGVIGRLAGQEHLGIEQHSGLVARAVYAGGGDDIVPGDGEEVRIRADEVALLGTCLLYTSRCV